MRLDHICAVGENSSSPPGSSRSARGTRGSACCLTARKCRTWAMTSTRTGTRYPVDSFGTGGGCDHVPCLLKSRRPVIRRCRDPAAAPARPPPRARTARLLPRWQHRGSCWRTASRSSRWSSWCASKCRENRRKKLLTTAAMNRRTANRQGRSFSVASRRDLNAPPSIRSS